MPITDELRQRLATAIGLSWEVVQTSIREAAIPQPPYKEPLMYLIYLIPEIPWRQSEKVASRLYGLGTPGQEALSLWAGLVESYHHHRPYHL